MKSLCNGIQCNNANIIGHVMW